MFFKGMKHGFLLDKDSYYVQINKSYGLQKMITTGDIIIEKQS